VVGTQRHETGIRTPTLSSEVTIGSKLRKSLMIFPRRNRETAL
jgi:hypothetical protein